MAQSHQSDDLAARLSDAGRQVVVGGRYRHYKKANRTYRVVSLGIIEASEEPCVIYQAEYDAKLLWVRPISDWLSLVEYEGQLIPRFSQIS